jgi:hypothetical protein
MQAITPAQLNDGRALHAMAVAARQRGAMAQAGWLIGQAIRNDPDQSGYYAEQATLYAEQHCFDDALRSMLEARRRQPADSGYYKAFLQLAHERSQRTPPCMADGDATVRLDCGSTLISVVMCSITPARETAAVAMYRRLLAGIPHEILIVRDARSMCEGYNRAIARSRGDVLILSHDDIQILSPNFAPLLIHHLQTFDMVGVAGTSCLSTPGWMSSGWPRNHGQVAQALPAQPPLLLVANQGAPAATPDIQALDGLFLAARRSVFDQLRFDEERFTGFHLYDIDFTFSAWQRGLRLAVCNDILIAHDSRGDFGAAWEVQAQRFLQKQGAQLAPLPSDNPLRFLGISFPTVADLMQYWHLLQRWTVTPYP